MTPGRRVDATAAAAAALGLVMIAVYLWLLGNEGDPPVVWYLIALTAATLLAAYGAVRAAPRRRIALIVAGAVMVVLGLLGIFSIGSPILIAGVLALAAAARQRIVTR